MRGDVSRQEPSQEPQGAGLDACIKRFLSTPAGLGQSKARRRETLLQLGGGIRDTRYLRHGKQSSEKFMATHGVAVQAGYAEAGQTMPRYAEQSRSEILGKSRALAGVATGPAAQVALKLLDEILRDLAREPGLLERLASGCRGAPAPSPPRPGAPSGLLQEPGQPVHSAQHHLPLRGRQRRTQQAPQHGHLLHEALAVAAELGRQALEARRRGRAGLRPAQRCAVLRTVEAQGLRR